jgi:hypothetical protein
VGNFLQDKNGDLILFKQLRMIQLNTIFIALISADIYMTLIKKTCLNVVRKHITFYHFG